MNKQSFLKLILEMGAVFIGISASFWVENYRIEKLKEQNLKASLEMIISDLDQDIMLLEKDSIFYINEISYMEAVMFNKTEDSDSISQFFYQLQTALYVDINQAGYSLLIEGDGFEMMNKELFRSISNFYSSTVKNYLANSEGQEVGLMIHIREYLFEYSEFKGLFPEQEELSKTAKMLRDTAFFRRLDALYLVRLTNQSLCQYQLKESRILREEIKSYIVEI